MSKIAILVAARNEALCIGSCLKALEALNIPKGHTLEILIGNDGSEDDTGNIAIGYCKRNPIFNYKYIREKKYGLKAKANVLAQLIELTDADFLLVTDADTIVPKNWLISMLKFAKEGRYDTVTGITLLKGDRIWAKWQCLEWMSMLNLAGVLSRYQIPFTAMGNNWYFSRKAYEKVGGYSSVGFSVTEDFALYNAFRREGFRFGQNCSKEVRAFSLPKDSLSALLSQRHRWLKGAWSGGWSIRLLGTLYCFQAVFWLILTFGYPNLLFLLLIKLLLQAYLQAYLCKSYQLKGMLLALISFEAYQLFFYPLLFISYFINKRKQVIWKGRKY